MQSALTLVDEISYQYLETILIVLMNPDINSDIASFCQRRIAGIIKSNWSRVTLLAEFIFQLYFDRKNSLQGFRASFHRNRSSSLSHLSKRKL